MQIYLKNFCIQALVILEKNSNFPSTFRWNYIDHYLSKLQCGFRKCYSTQNYFLFLLDNGNAQWIKERFLEYCFQNFPFDCFTHELLIAKLHVFCYRFVALTLRYSDLTNWKQRVTINSTYSYWEKHFLGFFMDLYVVLYCSVYFFVACSF